VNVEEAFKFSSSRWDWVWWRIVHLEIQRVHSATNPLVIVKET